MDSPRALSGARVLIVDDEPDHVEMYQYALEEAGFTVASALTGTSGIASACDSLPHLIVLDLCLPDMSGWDVCRALKADVDTASVPIVLLTAAASTTLGAEASNAGCVAHLLKPCYPDDLVHAIRSILAAAN